MPRTAHAAADRIRNVALVGHREAGKTSLHLIDTPGEPSLIADALGALGVCDSAVFVVDAVMGAEHEIRGLIDLVDMKAREYEGQGEDNGHEIAIPDALRPLADA